MLNTEALSGNTNNRYRNIDIDNPISVTVATMDKDVFDLRLKIGIIKDLYNRQLITQAQMEKLIKLLYQKEAD